MRNSDHCTAYPRGKSESGITLDDHHKDQLHQVANIVIDAYLSRNDSFVPEFAEGAEAVMYLCQDDAKDSTQGEANRKTPKLNFWYQQADYEDQRAETREKETEGSR